MLELREIGGARAGGRDRQGAVSALLAELARAPPAAHVPPAAPPLAPGTVIGRFEIVHELGRGGFGVVYRARDRELGREVAFKLVACAGPRAADERMVREAEAAANLLHPNLVTLFDVGRCEHGTYLVLELLRGRTIADRLEEGPLPPRQALHVAVQVARGLAHAHAHGVVHRDLAPSNLFLCEDGTVKVLDFGLAHAFGCPRQGGGTPSHMAPEQRRGAPEDERTDVFALGLVLHQLLTGELPARARRGHPRIAKVEGIPGLADTLGDMLEHDPVDRPRDGAEVAAALEALEAGEQPARPPARRRRMFLSTQVAIALAAATIGVGAGSALFVRTRPPPIPAVDATPIVAVADFANETGERDLDALSGLVVTSLEQSRQVRVLTRGRLLDLARQLGRSSVEHLDEGLAREAGSRGGARVLLVPAIRRQGDAYVAEARAVDLASGAPLFIVAEQAPTRSALPDLVDRLGERTRLALRENRAAIAAHRVRTGEAVTASLDAYRHYVLGLEHARVRFDSAQALVEFRRALAIDPHFALPQLEIALLASWHEAPGEDPDARIAAAAAEASRLPDKERRTILAFRSLLHGDLPAAVRQGRELVADYPADKEVLYVAGEALWHGAAPGGHAEAAELFRRALDLDPSFLVAAIHLFEWTARFGPPEEALARARRAVLINPGANSEAMLARALAIAGDVASAAAAARRAASIAEGTHFESSYTLAEVLAQAGGRDEAERELRRWLGPEVDAGSRRIALEYLPVLLASEGRRSAALAEWRRLTAERCGPDCESFDAEMRVHLQLAGGDERATLQALRAWPVAVADRRADELAWLWAFLGDLDAAEAHAARLLPGSTWERCHAAAAAIRRGRCAEAVEILRPVAAGSPWLEPSFLLGVALAGAGWDAEAVEAFGALERTHPIYAPMWEASLRPRALLESALAHERLGQLDEARGDLERLLARWSRADRDLPLITSARVAARRLGVVPSSPSSAKASRRPPERPPRAAR